MMIAFQCFFMFVLTIRWSLALDWRDAIPTPLDFKQPDDLSILIYMIKGVNDTHWSQAPDVTPFYYGNGGDYTESAVALSASKKIIYVIFRGTDVSQIADLIADAVFVRGPYGPINETGILPGTVSIGFNLKLFYPELYIPLTNMVTKAINQFPAFKLVVTGVSSGAALSSLYGAYLASKVVPRSYRVQVINFASPRFCNDVFKSAVRNLPNLSIWRMVNERDLVARSPPESLGYRHVGHLIYWNGYDNVKAYYQTEGDSSKGYKGVDFGSSGIINDHAKARYSRALALSLSDPTHFWPTAFERFPTTGPISSPTTAPAQRRCCIHIFICLFYCKI